MSVSSAETATNASAAIKFAEIDTNGDGGISLEEAGAWLGLEENISRQVPDVPLAFETMDLNHNGVIDPAEFDQDLQQGHVAGDNAPDDPHWTRERRENAKPHPMPQLPEGTLKQLAPLNPDLLEELYLPSGDVEDGQVPEGRVEPGSVATEMGVATTADTWKRPFWNGGKLYITKPEGDFTCTAQYVGSSRVVMTAAHCLTDKNGKETQTYLRFDQAGRQNKYVQCTFIPSNYSGHSDVQNDYAFLYMKDESSAGWMAFQSGRGDADVTAIGYPINYDCKKTMARVSGTISATTQPSRSMKHNPFAPGASGGAWIANLTVPHVGGNRVVGLTTHVNPHDKPSRDSSSTGPTFTRETYNLLLTAIEGCP